MAATVVPLRDKSDLVELCKALQLYLKPLARINVSVTLPQLKQPGQSISNWDLMERIKKLVQPTQFSGIKVAMSTIEFVRFEADVANGDEMARVLKTLDGGVLKVIGFFEALKVRAAEAKSECPTRADWDAFFAEPRNRMNEMRPGERPDTLSLSRLPCRWFAASTTDGAAPSEAVFRRVFEAFGEVRCVDVPVCDRFRVGASSSDLGGFSHGGELTFAGFVQYVEYIGFVKALAALRNMQLVRVDDSGRATAVAIKVDFDRTKHLSDKAIRRRRLERERLMRIERVRVAAENAQREQEESERRADEMRRAARQEDRERKRRIKHLNRKRSLEERQMERKIEAEERKLLLAQRKLESMRLLPEVLRRVQVARQSLARRSRRRRVQAARQKEQVERVEMDLQDAAVREAEARRRREMDEESRRGRLLRNREEQLRTRVRKHVNEKEERLEEFRREELRRRVGRQQVGSVALVAADERCQKRASRNSGNARPTPSFDMPRRYPSKAARHPRISVPSSGQSDCFAPSAAFSRPSSDSFPPSACNYT